MTKLKKHKQSLFSDVKQITEQGKHQITQAVNIGLAATYWQIGKRINDDFLNNERAEYGKQVVVSLSSKLTEEYGKGWSETTKTLSPLC